MRTNLHHLLEERASSTGTLPALTHEEICLDYAETWEQSWRAAGALRSLGVSRGDRVAVFLDKRPETIAAIFGASAAGAVFVPVNPALKAGQVAYILADCGV
ncbi:AMP-binding protein, partial [Nocardioides sp.]|uniref:AMP-binding protein n=1 Tax=Nocardioides sp. TaxID=35761 RepID=UPI00286E05BE